MRRRRLPTSTGGPLGIALVAFTDVISFSLPLVEELKRRDSDRPCLHAAEPHSGNTGRGARRRQ